jgi:hypothetical protein
MKGIVLKWNNLNEMESNLRNQGMKLLRILMESIRESESQEVHIR